MTMRFFPVVAFLIALSGCNYLLPPILLPAQDEDQEYLYFYACSEYEDSCYYSTRANTVSADANSIIELNAAVLAKYYSNTYNTSSDYNISTTTYPALWVGYEGESNLGIGIESELIITIGEQEYLATKRNDYLITSVLKRRYLGISSNEDRTCCVNFLRFRRHLDPKYDINPTEANSEHGEFAMYDVIPTVADRVLSATSIELEVRGTSGSLSTTVEGPPLERIKRMWGDDFPLYRGLIR